MAATAPARAVLALILLGTALRLGFAATLGLGIDESYMVAAGRVLRWSYFDHPPVSWWLSAEAARLVGSEAALVVRLPFVALFALSTWLMWRLASALFGARAGLWAAVAFNLSPVFGVTAASWVLPDGPLLCALLAAAYCLARALPDEHRWSWWIGAGAASGLALLSKYSAGLCIAGAGLYLLTQAEHRRWLTRPQPYVAALVAVALFAPVLVWNATHGWASFAFQGGRAEVEGLRPFGPLLVLGGEALFVLPWIWLPMMLAFLRALRDGPRAWRTWLLCCLGVLPVVLFALIGLWSRHVLFHWAAPGYLMLFPLLGAWLAEWETRRPRVLHRVTAGTAALLVIAAALVVGAVRLGVPAAFARKGDPTLQAVDWTALRPALAERGLLDRKGMRVAALNWQEGGKVGYGLGPDVPLVVLGPDPRQFGKAVLTPGEDLVLVSARPITVERLASEGVAFAHLGAAFAVPLRADGPAEVQVVLGEGLRAP
jgi:4-amino-4-deoxy-L-arabinose transferase-like glycosyltransferase